MASRPPWKCSRPPATLPSKTRACECCWATTASPPTKSTSSCRPSPTSPPTMHPKPSSRRFPRLSRRQRRMRHRGQFSRSRDRLPRGPPLSSTHPPLLPEKATPGKCWMPLSALEEIPARQKHQALRWRRHRFPETSCSRCYLDLTLLQFCRGCPPSSSGSRDPSTFPSTGCPYLRVRALNKITTMGDITEPCQQQIVSMCRAPLLLGKVPLFECWNSRPLELCLSEKLWPPIEIAIG